MDNVAILKCTAFDLVETGRDDEVFEMPVTQVWVRSAGRWVCLAVTPGLGSPRSRLAAALATSLEARPVLCDLISAQAPVMERNVSPQAATQYKRAAVANVVVLAWLVVDDVGELGQHHVGRFAAAAVMVTGAVWTSAQPLAAMLAACEADPALASIRLDFVAALREILEVRMPDPSRVLPAEPRHTAVRRATSGVPPPVGGHAA